MHLKMICCSTVSNVCMVTVDVGASAFSRKAGQTGRRFVTEATLIYSSRRSLKSSSRYDRLNVSRDVTFPQNLKRLSRALILSCLIVCWRSYDKQTRVVVGGEKGVGHGRLWMGRRCRAARPPSPPDPDAFANDPPVYFRQAPNASLNSEGVGSGTNGS